MKTVVSDELEWEPKRYLTSTSHRERRISGLDDRGARNGCDGGNVTSSRVVVAGETAGVTEMGAVVTETGQSIPETDASFFVPLASAVFRHGRGSNGGTGIFRGGANCSGAEGG